MVATVMNICLSILMVTITLYMFHIDKEFKYKNKEG